MLYYSLLAPYLIQWVNEFILHQTLNSRNCAASCKVLQFSFLSQMTFSAHQSLRFSCKLKAYIDHKTHIFDIQRKNKQWILKRKKKQLILINKTQYKGNAKLILACQTTHDKFHSFQKNDKTSFLLAQLPTLWFL